MTHLLAGLALGVAGSAHCAAMCGPLVLVAHAGGGARGRASRDWRIWTRLMPYHAGRALAYVMLGLLAGTAGGGLAGTGLGPVVSIAGGLLLIAHVTGLLARLPRPAWTTRVPGAVCGSVARTVSRRGVRSPVVHGALHGLLPCGTLYLALVAAAGLGGMTEAGIFMAGFAAGTTPVLAIIGATGPAIAARLPGAVWRAAPVAVALVGLLLIARGLGVAHPSHASAGVAPTAAVAEPHRAHPR